MITNYETAASTINQDTTTLESPVTSDCELRIDKLTALGIGATDWSALPRFDQFARLHEAVGHTTVEQFQLNPSLKITAKREFDNPSGSHYDRAYLATIEWLEANGHIAPGDELRDITSGSAGTSLALISTLLGYKSQITVPPELPAERITPMRLFGADVSVCGGGYIPAASEQQASEIKDLIRSGWKRHKIANEGVRAIVLTNGEDRICYLNHSENILSPQSFETIGSEILASTIEPLDAVMLAIGNWTTIAGISPIIRSAWPKTRIVGYRDSRPVHDSFGTNVANVPLRFDDNRLLDEVVEITPEERDSMDIRINASRPVLEQIGRSSLMGLCAAEAFAGKHGLQTVGTIFYDQKVRY